MTSVSSSITINKPVETVFSFVSAIDSQKSLSPSILEAKLTPPGPVALGSMFHYTTEVMGKKYESGVQVSAYEPNKKFAIKTTGTPRPTETVYTFEPAGTGTKLTMSTELTGGYPAAAEGAVKAQWQKSFDETGAKFKQLIEK